MNFFENIDLFSDLSTEDQKQLSMFCQSQKLVKDEILFSQGDEAQAMYVVLSGRLKVQKNISGVVQDIAILESGNIVGEIAFFGKNTRNATIISQTNTELVVIIQFGIEQMIQKYPDLYEKFKIIMQERR